jgi:hypothetical protein
VALSPSPVDISALYHSPPAWSNSSAGAARFPRLIFSINSAPFSTDFRNKKSLQNQWRSRIGKVLLAQYFGAIQRFRGTLGGTLSAISSAWVL